ncbi:MAG: response regulator [Candidatus Binataceae bacterium]
MPTRRSSDTIAIFASHPWSRATDRSRHVGENTDYASKITVLLVDDNEIFRRGLRLTLEQDPGIVVVGEASVSEEALKSAQRTQPDIAFLGFTRQERVVIELCRRVIRECPRTKIIILAVHLHDEMVYRALAAGAKGFVSRDLEPNQLSTIIRSAHTGETVLDHRIITPLLLSIEGKRADGPDAIELAKIDLAILRHVADGSTTPQIAKRLRRNPYAIRARLERLRALLKVRSGPALIAEAVRRGLVQR